MQILMQILLWIGVEVVTLAILLYVLRVWIGIHIRQKRHALLNSSDPTVRRDAANYLGTMRDQEAIPLLIQALRDTEEQVRASALLALMPNNMGLSAIPLLIELLGDANASLRQAAEMVLKSNGYIEYSIPAIIEAYDKTSDDNLKSQLAISLNLFSSYSRDAIIEKESKRLQQIAKKMLWKE
jgi:HEAT repeat protein